MPGDGWGHRRSHYQVKKSVKQEKKVKDQKQEELYSQGES